MALVAHSHAAQLISRTYGRVKLLARRGRRVAWAIVAIGLLILAIQAADREPPFAVLSVEPAAARPGEIVKIRARVRRDVGRECSAEFSRYVFDATGSRSFLDTNRVTAGFIQYLEVRTPGRLDLSFVVPVQAAPGPARLVTSLEYVCNRTHVLLPIEVVTVVPFEILP